MSAALERDADKQRSGLWVWWVCGLLLCASTINYMDRQTLANTSVRITEEMKLSDADYGNLEWAFGWAFAVGASIFGYIADRTNIRWLYPAALLGWSTVGFLTGFVETYTGLLACRLCLGLFEAGHWPCALKTTQKLLPPHRRTLGNSVLQSGTAIGAIITPKIIKAMMTTEPGSWRPAFQMIGLIGAGWVALWILTIRGRELAPQTAVATDESASAGFWSIILQRRFLVLFVVVILINTCYHFFRAWLPKFLVKGRGYSEPEMLDIVFWFYVANDVGCITAGFVTTALHRRGWSVHGSRLWVFGTCGLLTATSLYLPFLPAGDQLFSVLMVLSAGSLGLFPCYYSFSQELSVKHQGKVTGLLGMSAWLFTSPLHTLFGKWIDATGRHDWGLALAGMLPLIGLVAIAVGWGRDHSGTNDVAS